MVAWTSPVGVQRLVTSYGEPCPDSDLCPMDASGWKHCYFHLSAMNCKMTRRIPWLSDLCLADNNRLHSWWIIENGSSNYAAVPPRGEQGFESVALKSWGGAAVGACSAKAIELPCGSASCVTGSYRNISVLTLLFILFFSLPPFSLTQFPYSFIYTLGIIFFHISRVLKSIIEKLETDSEQKKKKFLFTQHATTWRKLLSVNIPFPVFLCTFFKACIVHLTIFGNSVYVPKNSSTWMAGWKNHNLFNQAHVTGHSIYFQFSTFRNNVIVNVSVAKYLHTFSIVFLGRIPKNGIAGSKW